VVHSLSNLKGCTSPMSFGLISLTDHQKVKFCSINYIGLVVV
jgi:hypothetical protein